MVYWRRELDCPKLIVRSSVHDFSEDEVRPVLIGSKCGPASVVSLNTVSNYFLFLAEGISITFLLHLLSPDV